MSQEMHVEIDLTRIPATMLLQGAEDFQSFKVLVKVGEDTLVSPGTLLELAGSRANAPARRERFEKMLAFAKEQGWVDVSRGVRAHIELDKDVR